MAPPRALCRGAVLASLSMIVLLVAHLVVPAVARPAADQVDGIVETAQRDLLSGAPLELPLETYDPQQRGVRLAVWAATSADADEGNNPPADECPCRGGRRV